jgi:hypothetical protein
MQFNIRTLLAITAAVSIFCGLVFAAPPLVATPILIAVLWISPSLWINGIIYGRGAWRPFFIGGTIAGFGPHLGALYYAVMVVAQLLDGDGWAELLEGDRWTNLHIAAVFLFPGVFALLGGLVGVWTWWMFQPEKTPASADPRTNHAPAVDEYVIVSGRLTTAPIERKT